MNLNDKEVELLVRTINPVVEYYREVNTKRFEALQALQTRLELYYDTAQQLELDYQKASKAK